MTLRELVEAVHREGGDEDTLLVMYDRQQTNLDFVLRFDEETNVAELVNWTPPKNRDCYN